MLCSEAHQQLHYYVMASFLCSRDVCSKRMSLLVLPVKMNCSGYKKSSIVYMICGLLQSLRI